MSVKLHSRKQAQTLASKLNQIAITTDKVVLVQGERGRNVIVQEYNAKGKIARTTVVNQKGEASIV